MKIASPDLISAIEWPGKLSYVLFVSGCNFRCGFCYNPDLVLDNPELETMSEEEVLKKLNSLKDKKFVDAVCITGGEPLIHKEIENLIRKIRKFKFPVRIETNGSKPRLLKKLIEYGLVQSVALDIKTSKEKYKQATNCKIKIKNLEKSILIVSLLDNYEFRTTVVPNLVTKEDIIKIKNWLLHVTSQDILKAYYLQRFKTGKLLNLLFNKIQPYSDEILEQMKKSVEKYFKICKIR